MHIHNHISKFFVLALLIAPVASFAFFGGGTKGPIVDPPTPPIPFVEVRTSSSIVFAGQTVTISWNAEHVYSCGGLGSSNITGSVDRSPLTTTTYTVTCVGSGGTINDSVTVVVAPPPESCSAGSSQDVAMYIVDNDFKAASIWANARINSTYEPGEPIYATGSLWSDDAPRACPSISINGVSFSLGCNLQLTVTDTEFVLNAPTTPGTYNLPWSVGNAPNYLVGQSCPLTYTVSAPTPEPQPDLTASAVSPRSATAGSAQTFSATISNGGNATASASATRFQRATSAGGASATSIGSASTPAISAGASRTASISYSFPSAGTWYLRACADTNNQVAESNEGNNCGPWVAVSVAGAPQADLVPVAMTPSTATQGQSTPVTMTIRNAGNANASNFPNFIWVDINQNGAYNGPQEAIWNGRISLAAGGSQTVSTTHTFPSAGSYVIGGCTDNTPSWGPPSVSESNEGNNCWAQIVSVSAPAQPDLTASAVSPRSATTGSAQTFSATVSNDGNATASASATRFQRATSAGGASATSIGTASTPAISAGASRTASISYSFPSAGTWYLRACADTNNQVSESNEGNNCGPWVSVSVSAPTPSPTATLSASQTSITRGDSSTLTWSSTNATSCTGSGFSTGGSTSGSVAAGSAVTVSPNSSTDYSITCTGAGGSANDSVSVTVSAPVPSPTATLSASPTSITRGDSSTLTWSSTNATRCTGSGFSTGGSTSGSVAAGSAVTVSPNSSADYSITCTGAGGSDTDVVSIQVIEPEVSITADDERVIPGESTRIRWTASDINSCTVSGPDFSVVENPSSAPGNLSGNRSVTVSVRSTYEIVCQTAVGGPVQDSVEVKVAPDFEEF